jgi:exopolyphosphatase / guanosine-5'-triphosphate,3'-diphosphate pyrophosphatase
MIKCSIDIGTNSVRMLVADVGDCGFRQIHQDGAITRLGEGMIFLGTIRRDAAERTINKVVEFIHKARELDAQEINIVATSAARDAVNGKFVLERIKEETGEDVLILSGEEEAGNVYKGVAASLDLVAGKNAIIDIGGGSTELIFSDKSGDHSLRSINAGAVRMSEGYLGHDPPLKEEIANAVDACREAWEEADLFGNMTGYQLVGVGGTITTLSAVKMQLEQYGRNLVHDSELTLSEIRRILDELISVPLDKREGMPGLEPGRADIIIAGTLVLIFVMEKLEVDSLRVSDDGILVGLLV